MRKKDVPDTIMCRAKGTWTARNIEPKMRLGISRVPIKRGG
jgi:hypothetical protein